MDSIFYVFKVAFVIFITMMSVTVVAMIIQSIFKKHF